MQLTANVSVFRLLTESLEAVIAARETYAGLGLTDYEVLPHLNRHEPWFLERVRSYSERSGCDIVGLADGAAWLHTGAGGVRCFGRAVRFRDGARTDVQDGTL